MAKKRKATPQSSTILDFFGNRSSGPGPGVAKKSRLREVAPPRKTSSTAGRGVPEEIIVIDSDEDEIVEVPVHRPSPKPIQSVPMLPPEALPTELGNVEVRHTTPILTDLIWTLMIAVMFVSASHFGLKYDSRL